MKLKLESVMKGSLNFSESMIEALRLAYSQISNINPDSDNYKKLISLLDKLDKNALQKLSKANIKFVSMLAKNRLKD